MIPILTLIRPHHWIKNLLVFTPLFFALAFTAENFAHATFTVAAFSLTASAIYVLNDIADVEADRKHPTKRNRPIASGKVAIPTAWFVFATLLILSSALVWYLLPRSIVGVLITYFLLNVAYSFSLKKLLIIDVMTIALGFVLRVIAGGLAVGVPISSWILLVTFFGSLLLGFGKRKNEVTVMAEGSRSHRKVLEHYTPDMLNVLLGVTAGMTIMSYALYTIDTATVAKFGSDKLVFTLPFVAFGIFHYFHLMYNQKSGGDPTKIFSRDIPTLTTIALWLATFYAITMLG